MDVDRPISFVDLPDVLIDKVRDVLVEAGDPDAVTALRGTCKALREVVKPLKEDGKEYLTVEGATKSLARLHWALHQCGLPDDANVPVPARFQTRFCAAAAGVGSIEVLRECRMRGFVWDRKSCGSAARGGHLEVLKWLRQNGAPWHEMACAYVAACGGHLEVLKWLRQNGAPWYAMTCANAALGGHLEVLKWARQNGAPWDANTCKLAAYGGHLEVLKWARENGAPWDHHGCYSYAESESRSAVLTWLQETECVVN